VTVPPVLNTHPAGVLIIKVTLVPLVKSEDEFLVSVKLPNVVNAPPAGFTEFAALSAEIFVPPDAAVIVTVAFAVNELANKQTTVNTTAE